MVLVQFAASRHRIFFRLLVVLVCAMGPPASRVWSAEATALFDLPADTLEKSVKRFAAQTGLEILIAGDALAETRTKPVRGRFTPRHALDHMLQGTGLSVLQDPNSGALAIRREVSPRAAPTPPKPAKNPGTAATPRASTNDPLAMPSPRKPSLLRSVLASAAASVSLAQTAPQPTSSASESEKLVLTPFTVSSERDYGYRATNSVTATRNARSIFETPLAVSVLNEDFLIDTAGTGNLLDATRYSASVAGETRNDGASRGVFGVGNGTIRGFPVDAILRNGVYRRSGFSFDNAERIEILKGPVSVFFGAAQPGGTINYITKQPEFARKGRITGIFTEYPSKWATNASSTAGYQGQVFYNDHIGDKFAYSLYGSSQDRGGWHDHEYFRSNKLQPSLLWRPNRIVKLLVEFEYLDYHSNPANSSAIGNPKQFADYANPPAEVLAANGLTAAQYRTQILGSQANWANLWLNTVGDRGNAIRTYNLYYNSGLGEKAVGRPLPTTVPSFSFQGPGHFQDTETETYSAELTVTPWSWLNTRFVAAKNRTTSDWVSTFRGNANADYTYNLATGNGAISVNDDENAQVDLLARFATGFLSHTLVLGGDYFNNDATNRNRTFNYNLAPSVVSASGTVLSGLAAIQNWNPLLHGGVPDSSRYVTGFANLTRTDAKSYGRYATWTGEFRVAGRKVLLTWGERREQYVVHDSNLLRADSRGPSSTQGVVVSLTDWLNVYASKSSNYRPNGPGFPGGGLSAVGVGVNRDLNGNLIAGANEAALLPDQTGKSIEAGIKVQTSDGKWSASLGWFQVERANVRLGDLAKGLADPRNTDGSFYPANYNPDGTPILSSLRQVDPGFRPVTFFTASGKQRNQGIELEGFWTPRSNYQLSLSLTNIYFSRTLSNNSLTGANAWEILESGRRLGYSPEWAIGLFNKFTFTEGVLKGFSIAGGVNGQTKTNPRYESSQDADGFNPSYIVGDLTLGYRTKAFGRNVSYTLSCSNVADHLHYKGQFGYGDPRRITFRTDFNF
jgi:outer membrane receptor protein involved in Fe transport